MHPFFSEFQSLQEASSAALGFALAAHDLAGGLGAILLLGTYFLLQIDRISAKSMLYSQLNGLGSGLILVSLMFNFNLSAFVIEACWFVISCIGAAVTLRNSWGSSKNKLPFDSQGKQRPS